MYNTNRLNISDFISHIISITDLGRGKATQVLNAVVNEKVPFLIFKNNKPRAALVDIDIYNDLIETKQKYDELKEEEYLLRLAEERMAASDPDKATIFEDAAKKYNVSIADLDALADKIKIE